MMRSVVLCSWFILSWCASRADSEKRSYMTYDMAVICKRLPNFKIRMHHSSAGSTGILKATDYLAADEELECSAQITPPKGYGVIYHLEEIEMRKDVNNDCRDYLKIYDQFSPQNVSGPICRDCCRFTRTKQTCRHCGVEPDGLVCEEFCDMYNDTTYALTGYSRDLAVHYHTRCSTCTERKEKVGFQMVFTAYKLGTAGHDSSCTLQSEFKCDNGRCIWSGLTCDGHNNCGDMSDENNSGNSRCAEFPDPMKAVIVASAVIVTVLLGVVLAYLPKMSWQTVLGKNKTNARAFRLDKVNATMTPSSSSNHLAVKKPSRNVTFQNPLPKIKENYFDESEV